MKTKKENPNKHIPFCCGKIPCIKWKIPASPCFEIERKSKLHKEKNKK